MKKCSISGWTPIFAYARSKNFGSLDDINEFFNVAKNDYTVNQAVGRIDRFMPIAIFGSKIWVKLMSRTRSEFFNFGIMFCG